MDDLPFAVAAVPDAGLLGLGRAGDAPRIHVLRDADVGDAGRLVPHQVDVGVQDRRVHGFAVPGPHWKGDEEKGGFGWLLDLGRGDPGVRLSKWWARDGFP